MRCGRRRTPACLLIQSLQAKIRRPRKGGAGFVAGIGVGLLLFVAAFVVARHRSQPLVRRAAVHALRSSSASPAREGRRVYEAVHGNRTAVAQGVIGVAFIQAILVGLFLLLAGVPWAGVLALIVLVLGIAQVPALIVTLPAIGYIWWTGEYGTVEASSTARCSSSREWPTTCSSH
jgi:predicted PurR-regulated permease PerM